MPQPSRMESRPPARKQEEGEETGRTDGKGEWGGAQWAQSHLNPGFANLGPRALNVVESVTATHVLGSRKNSQRRVPEARAPRLPVRAPRSGTVLQ